MGEMEGMVSFQKVSQALAPSTRAASKREGLMV